MQKWYCHIGGQRYGPAGEDTLRTWIQEGRLAGEHLIWSEGMPEWTPARNALPHLFQPAPPIANALVTVPPPGGTGGATPNAQLMAGARELLAGHWGKAILFYVLFILFNVAIQIAPWAGGILSLILAGPLVLSVVVFFLTLARKGNGEYGMLFWGFRSFGKALAAYLLVTLFTGLWMLLLIVPGIIAAISYSQTFFLLADDTRLGPLEAIRKSRQIMHGYKWKYFCLCLRFVGWVLLCILTLGIGFLFLGPYMQVSYARFYDDLIVSRVPLAGTGGVSGAGQAESLPGG
jgi:uncharacterized membrane protein